jgi:flagellar protein FlgJ
VSVLKSSVGRGKPNDPGDVRTVQRLLNASISRLVRLSPLLEDGRFGPKTEATILEFQRRVLSVHAPDAIVDPYGPAIQALTGSRTHNTEPPYVAIFIKMALPAAINVRAKWGVPVAVTIAQSAQETGWGRKVVGNAYFGVKGKSPKGASTSFGTTEVVDGKVIHIKDQFRAYTGYADAADDYGRLLSENSRYKGAFAFKNDPIAFVEAIAKAGYATDPNYGRDLKNIIRTHNLQRL